MKLASFEISGKPSWGIVEKDVVIDLGKEMHRYTDLRSAIAGNAYAQIADAARRAPRYRPSDIKWRPVIDNPDKIICIGLNFEEHRKETGRAEAAFPTVFTRFANSQTGHLRDVPRPRVSRELDYEGELAVIIGKAARYVAQSDALACVAGYACYNDISVRDWQHHTHQFAPEEFPSHWRLWAVDGHARRDGRSGAASTAKRE